MVKMGKRDLQSSADKLKKMPSAMVARVRPKPRRTGPIWFLAGLAGGATALYFFDSKQGASRRRALLDRIAAGGSNIMELSDKAMGKTDQRHPDAEAELADTGTLN